MGSSYGMLDLTVYGRQETWEDSPAGWPQRWDSAGGLMSTDITGSVVMTPLECRTDRNPVSAMVRSDNSDTNSMYLSGGADYADLRRKQGCF